MKARFFEIAEAQQTMPHPLPERKIMQLAATCAVNGGTRVLDLACGKGELLCQWSLRYNLKGLGVDASERVIQAALERANELKVWMNIHFLTEAPGEYPQAFHEYDIVVNLNGSWLEASLVDKLAVMSIALKEDEGGGLVILGETFWQKTPSAAVLAELGIAQGVIPALGDLADAFDAAGFEVVAMLTATPDDWDQYHAAQWRATSQFLREHPDDPDYAALRAWIDANRRRYFKAEREYIGWGAFVLRPLSRV